MKKNLIYAIVAIVCLSFTGILFAELETGELRGRKGNRQRRKHFDSSKMLSHMTKNLDLTDEQKAKGEKLSKEFQEKVKEIREGDLERSQKREAIQRLRKDLIEKIDATLTPEQLEKAKQSRQERKRMRNQKQNRKRERKHDQHSGPCSK